MLRFIFFQLSTSSNDTQWCVWATSFVTQLFAVRCTYAVYAQHRDGKWYLMVRVGDSLPSQMLDVRVSLYLYRWRQRVTAEGEEVPLEVLELAAAPSEGRLLLRYPGTVAHELGADSPIRGWATAEGLMQDSDEEVVAVVQVGVPS